MTIGFVASPGKCLTCGGDLVAVAHIDLGHEMNQFDEALNLIFAPGWGEAIDGDQLVDFVLCKVCTKRLFETFPGLKEHLEYYSNSSLTGPSKRLNKMRPPFLA